MAQGVCTHRVQIVSHLSFLCISVPRACYSVKYVVKMRVAGRFGLSHLHLNSALCTLINVNRGCRRNGNPNNFLLLHIYVSIFTLWLVVASTVHSISLPSPFSKIFYGLYFFRAAPPCSLSLVGLNKRTKEIPIVCKKQEAGASAAARAQPRAPGLYLQYCWRRDCW